MATSMHGVEQKVNQIVDGKVDQMNAFDKCDRQASDASTAEPSPSVFHRHISELDSDFEELQEEVKGDCTFGELKGLQELKNDCNAPSSIFKVLHPVPDPQNLANFIVPTLLCLVMRAVLSSASLYVVMGTVAALMILPGIYLYVVDGCRPEDYEASASESKWCVLTCVSASLGFISLSSMSISTMLCIIMGIVAVFMLMPGIYLHIIDGCRPEGYDAHQRRGGVFVILLVSGFLSFHGMMCIYIAFRVLIGALAVLMLLPGVYLYAVDGCRPEGCEEKVSKTQGRMQVLVLASLGITSLLGMCVSATFRFFMGVVAALLLLPGIYLYVVDGCRPEDDREVSKLKED